MKHLPDVARRFGLSIVLVSLLMAGQDVEGKRKDGNPCYHEDLTGGGGGQALACTLKHCGWDGPTALAIMGKAVDEDAVITGEVECSGASVLCERPPEVKNVCEGVNVFREVSKVDGSCRANTKEFYDSGAIVTCVSTNARDTALDIVNDIVGSTTTGGTHAPYAMSVMMFGVGGAVSGLECNPHACLAITPVCSVANAVRRCSVRLGLNLLDAPEPTAERDAR